MTVSKTKTGKWKARVRKSGVRKARTFAKKEHAIEWKNVQIANIEAEIARNVFDADVYGLTFNDMADKFEESAEGRRKEIRDRALVGRIEFWRCAFGDLFWHQITKQMVVDEIIEYLAQPAQRRKRNGDLYSLNRPRTKAAADRLIAAGSTVFTFAERAMKVKVNPFRVTVHENHRHDVSLYSNANY